MKQFDKPNSSVWTFRIENAGQILAQNAQAAA
jgi:hypothetical protein